jgi:hypothetical protein
MPWYAASNLIVNPDGTRAKEFPRGTKRLAKEPSHQSQERALQADGSVRIDCAATADFVDTSGLTWRSDRFVTGGTATLNSVSLPGNALATLYTTERYGSTISYAIPVANGTYRVGLHFIETWWTSAGQRIFDIYLQDQLAIGAFDIVGAAGGQRIPTIQYVLVQVTGGMVNLRMQATTDNARIEALQVVPAAPGAVRIDTGSGRTFVAPDGSVWENDQYYTGGARWSNSVSLPGNALATIYGTERWGPTISYAIPIANGSYRVGLHFIETWLTGPGQRIFNIFVQDVLVFPAFDVFAAAGGGRIPVVRYANVTVTASVLRIRLVATADAARIDGIEVIPMTPTPAPTGAPIRPTSAPTVGPPTPAPSPAPPTSSPTRTPTSLPTPMPPIPNQAPIVSAGSFQTTSPNVAITLRGSASDDGLPTSPGRLTYAWTVLFGPGTVAFTSVSDPRTSATFSAIGSYVLQLSVTDGQASSTGTVTVTVTSTPQVRSSRADVLLLQLTAGLAMQGYASGAIDRLYAVNMLERMVRPVFECLANGTLRSLLPVDATLGYRVQFMYDEAFTRALAGLASWLELGPDATSEGLRRANMIDLVIRAVNNAFNPASPDYTTMNRGTQSYVEASFLALAMVRAPTQVWARLSAASQAAIVTVWRSVSASGAQMPDNNFVSVLCVDGGS